MAERENQEFPDDKELSQMEESGGIVPLSLLHKPLDNTSFISLTPGHKTSWFWKQYNKFHHDTFSDRFISNWVEPDNPSFAKRDGKIKGGTMIDERVREIVKEEVDNVYQVLLHKLQQELRSCPDQDKERIKRENVKKALDATEMMNCSEGAANHGMKWHPSDEAWLQSQIKDFVAHCAHSLKRSRRGIIWKVVSLIHEINDADILWKKKREDVCRQTPGTFRFNVRRLLVCNITINPAHMERILDQIMTELDRTIGR